MHEPDESLVMLRVSALAIVILNSIGTVPKHSFESTGFPTSPVKSRLLLEIHLTYSPMVPVKPSGKLAMKYGTGVGWRELDSANASSFLKHSRSRA